MTVVPTPRALSKFSVPLWAEAIDWTMPIGTPIYPARSGVVIGLRTGCILGGPDKKWMRDGNYMIIKHDDGTMSEYLHLQHNGVLVHLGDRITPDQSIALSGNTGCTTEPTQDTPSVIWGAHMP